MNPHEQFARAVLRLLETDPEWNAGTTDAIAREAILLGLARMNPKTGLFETIG